MLHSDDRSVFKFYSKIKALVCGSWALYIGDNGGWQDGMLASSLLFIVMCGKIVKNMEKQGKRQRSILEPHLA